MSRKLSIVNTLFLSVMFISACAAPSATMGSTQSSNTGVLRSTKTAPPLSASGSNKSLTPTVASTGIATAIAVSISATEDALPSPTAENALAPETNPVGDIPDNQAFIAYTSPSGGYSLEVPEGWARTDQGADVRFVSKFDGVSLTLKPANSAPTATGVPQKEALELAKTERAFQVGQVSEVQLPGGKVVQINATANSDPDPVTGKQVRLEETFYLFFQNGKLEVLKVWAPQGTDNVDQWKRISESFRWN